jgi:hypothetical protein
VRFYADIIAYQKYQEMKRSEREYAKERQKLTKDKDAGVTAFGVALVAP